MIVLGLILVMVAVAAGVLLFLGADSLTTPIDLEVAGQKLGLTPLGLLVAGALVMLLLWLGLALIRASVKHRRRPAREAREAERQAKLEESIRADERASAEEQHRGVIADRDQVKEDEFQARMAERERERERDFAARQEDLEQRIRADERTRVEQERASMAAAPAPVGDDVRTADVRDDDDRTGLEDRTAPHDQGGDGNVASDDRTRAEEPPPPPPAEPGERTIADKIMGRDPKPPGE